MKQVTEPNGPFLVVETFSGPNFYQKDGPAEEEMQVGIKAARGLDALNCPPGYIKLEGGETINFDGDRIPLPPVPITLIHMYPG